MFTNFKLSEPVYVSAVCCKPKDYAHENTVLFIAFDISDPVEVGGGSIDI